MRRKKKGERKEGISQVLKQCRMSCRLRWLSDTSSLDYKHVHSPGQVQGVVCSVFSNEWSNTRCTKWRNGADIFEVMKLLFFSIASTGICLLKSPPRFWPFLHRTSHFCDMWLTCLKDIISSTFFMIFVSFIFSLRGITFHLVSMWSKQHCRNMARVSQWECWSDGVQSSIGIIQEYYLHFLSSTKLRGIFFFF